MHSTSSSTMDRLTQSESSPAIGSFQGLHSRTEDYDGAPGKSSLLRSGPLDPRRGNAATAGATAPAPALPLPAALCMRESERASEGRGVSPPGGPRRPGRRPTLFRALWTDGDVALLY